MLVFNSRGDADEAYRGGRIVAVYGVKSYRPPQFLVVAGFYEICGRRRH